MQKQFSFFTSNLSVAPLGGPNDWEVKGVLAG